MKSCWCGAGSLSYRCPTLHDWQTISTFSISDKKTKPKKERIWLPVEVFGGLYQKCQGLRTIALFCTFFTWSFCYPKLVPVSLYCSCVNGSTFWATSLHWTSSSDLREPLNLTDDGDFYPDVGARVGETRFWTWLFTFQSGTQAFTLVSLVLRSFDCIKRRYQRWHWDCVGS